jgi:molecular chaperone DnaK
LPVGSDIEIALMMDQSQQVRLQAYVKTLDEDFEISYGRHMEHNSLAELRKEAQEQKTRLANAREKVEQTKALKALAAVARIEDLQLLRQVDSLIEAADDDPDAVVQLDRRLRELAAAVDDVEDALQWPVFLEKAEESSKDAEHVIEQFDGNADDRNRLHQLREELQHAIDVGDLDLLRRYIEELDGLYFQVLNRQPAYHIARFNRLVERVQSMHNPQQADQLVTEGRRAINNNAIEALKAVNRQLLGLLPRDVQKEAKDFHTGDTMTKE